jgi:hypothetical protein
MSDENNRIYSTMETEGRSVDGSVPIEELQALVEEWEGTDTDPTLYRDSLTRGINELQAVIEAYE